MKNLFRHLLWIFLQLFLVRSIENCNFNKLPLGLLSKKNRSNPNQLHKLEFYIRSHDNGFVESYLLNISNPEHIDYGKYLSRDQIHDLQGKSASAKFVQNFLNSHGISSKVSNYSNFLTSIAPIMHWESLFTTEFFDFQYLKGGFNGGTIVRAFQITLPEKLKEHVSEIFNTVQFPIHPSTSSKINHNNPTITPESNSPGSVTPSLLYSYYSIGSNIGSSQSTQGVYETVNQSTSPHDLSLFQQHFSLPLQSLSQDINGHVSNSACLPTINNCMEANLDVQYLMATSRYSPTTYYYDSSSDFLLTWALVISQMPSPPLVFSISYGADETQLSVSYLNLFQQEVITLGVMGVTVIVSSGDNGALPNGISSSNQCNYSPQFPATCPYVTAVGATQGPESGSSEVVCQANSQPSSIITSGGGFSTYYSRPAFQNTQVQTYFSTRVSSPALGYQMNGRGYPDVSLLGYNYQVYLSSSLYLVSGTSAAAPVFAGMVSMINAARLQQGLSPVGWINPVLYSLQTSSAASSGLLKNDIVSGDNTCGALLSPSSPSSAPSVVCCPQGFSAEIGWDPVSGLGSIDYEKMKSLFVPPLPTPSPSLSPSSPPDASRSSSSSSSSLSLSTPAIIGMTVGIFLTALGSFGLVYYQCCREGKRRGIEKNGRHSIKEREEWKNKQEGKGEGEEIQMRPLPQDLPFPLSPSPPPSSLSSPSSSPSINSIPIKPPKKNKSIPYSDII